MVQAAAHVTPVPKTSPVSTIRHLCAVNATGDYMTDLGTGEALARQALMHMRGANFTSLLGWLVGDMIERGRFGGVEIGFMRTIAQAAVQGFRQ